MWKRSNAKPPLLGVGQGQFEQLEQLEQERVSGSPQEVCSTTSMTSPLLRTDLFQTQVRQRRFYYHGTLHAT